MMIARRDLFWGYLAQIMGIGLGLVMLPVVVRYMSTSEVGLWFVFTTLASLAQLLELGFQPTISRNIAYIYAGAQNLSADGIRENDGGELNVQLLRNLIAASRLIYRWIALLASGVLLAGGTFYISTLLPNSNNASIYWGWGAFAIGNIVNYYYGYLNALLQGRGDVTAANKVIVASRGVQVLVGIITVVAGLGLLGLGLACLVSTVVSRMLARHFVFSKSHPEMATLSANHEDTKSLVKILWHNASRFGIVLVGVFLIYRGNILIASSFLGLADAASYGLAIQIFLLMISISMVPFNLALPKLNTLRMQKKQKDSYKTFGALLAMGLLIYTAMDLSLLSFGSFLLNLVGSSTRLPDFYVLLAMSVVFLLEINHGICANFITTENTVPFVKASTITGVCIVVTSMLLAPVLGIAGLVISQGTMQLIYNNWKWPMVVKDIFSKPYTNILSDGFLSLNSYLKSRGRV